MSAQSPDLQAKIQLWRAKAREGTLTQDEMREAILALRRDRLSISAPATAGSKVNRTRAVAKAKPNSDDLLAELDNL